MKRATFLSSSNLPNATFRATEGAGADAGTIIKCGKSGMSLQLINAFDGLMVSLYTDTLISDI